MSSNKAKDIRRQQRKAEEQRAAAQAAPAVVAEPKQDDSQALVKERVESLIAEVEGAANFGAEYLQASTFVRRFNQLAMNTHKQHNFEAAVVSEDPREAKVFYNFEVIATWKPTVATGADLTQDQTAKSNQGKVLNADGSEVDLPPKEEQPVPTPERQVEEASTGGVKVPEPEVTASNPPSAVVNTPEALAAQAVADEEKRQADIAAGILVVDPADKLPVTPNPREAAESQNEQPNPNPGPAIEEAVEQRQQ